MKEKELRNYHRRIGIIVVVFVFIQALSGLMFSIETIAPGMHLDRIADPIHFGGGLSGSIYRIFVALGLLFMAGTGSWIFLKIRSRTLSVSQNKPQQPIIPG
ncbi:MAG: hypothetical protein WCU00_03550 [Candidatus Latescibacterota bacterium]